MFTIQETEDGNRLQMVAIRAAQGSDVEAITAIYNEAVRTTTASFDLAPRTLEDRRAWFDGHDKNHPVLVAEVDGDVVGWASLSRFGDREGYDGTAEISLYVCESERGKGIGRDLLAATLAAGENTNLRTVIARITSENEISLRLHRSAGFERAGVLRKAGFKFGRLLDVVFMQYFFDG